MSTIPMSRRTRQFLIVYGLPFLAVGAAIALTICAINFTNENRTLSLMFFAAIMISTWYNFPITETTRFQIRAEAFNVLNRPNFFIGNVSFTPSGTSFNINSTNFSRINTTFDPHHSVRWSF